MSICLDKSLKETFNIVSEETRVPRYLEIQKQLGIMNSFNFVQSNVQIPIEHIGLAILAYESAIDQFTFTKVNDDGSTQKMFESLLDSGSCIGNFLDEIYPDSLSWYCNENGPSRVECFVCNGRKKPQIDKNFRGKDFNEDGEDLRELTIVEAYNCAVNTYLANEDSENFDAQNFIDENAKQFNYKLSSLMQKSEINSNASNQQDSIISAPEQT